MASAFAALDAEHNPFEGERIADVGGADDDSTRLVLFLGATRGLLASIPGGTPGKRLRAIDGSVPLLGALPPGCAFNPRCPDRFHLCTSAPPPEYVVGSEHAARCYLHDEALGPAKAGHSVHDK